MALGHDIRDSDRLAQLLDTCGRVDRTEVTAALTSLGIGADHEDEKALAGDLDTMRVTDHRPVGALDQSLADIDELLEGLPEAILELRKSKEQRTLEMSYRFATYDKALMKLLRAATAARRFAVWDSSKQTWHDDAMCIALHLRRIAVRNGEANKLSFTSSDGSTTRFVANMLELAGIHKTPTNVSKALKSHPQAKWIGLESDSELMWNEPSA